MNLAQSLLDAADRHVDAEAVVDGNSRLTYAELLDRAQRLAGGLDVGPGDRLAAVVKCRRESVELYWACQWLGVTFVPLSHRVSQADLDYCREDSAAKAWFEVDADVEPLLGPAHEGELDRDEREESLMLYTSGTTGRPKGVPRSHRSDRAGGLSQALQHGYRFGDRTLGVMPLYHTMGMHSLIAMSLIGGCYVCQPDWDAEAALALIERERITSLYLAPTLFHDLVWHPRRGDFDLSSVETLSYAGAAMTGALVERCVEVFRPRLFVNHYGSTEIYTFAVHRNQAAKPGCAGRPSINARLRLDEDGEILCHMSSDEAFAGYWNRPDADEKAICDGWYRTGDVGQLDEDCDLWIVGRVDDMIVSGGENIHPLEVEDVLARHPAVREVAVVAAPDDRLGQRVVAVVVGSGEVDAEALDRFCLASETLARFKRPREYRFVDELPKSPSGKILRRMLREESTT
ncbi:MAG TPA: AMP-binding protein [Gaiellaceae bacterium]|nr:AMP-binding protein [Gaiellaceae bacterium]